MRKFFFILLLLLLSIPCYAFHNLDNAFTNLRLVTPGVISNIKSIYNWGDSISAGYGLSSSTLSYAHLVAGAYGASLSDYGTPGQTQWDVANRVYISGYQPNTGDVSLVEGLINEVSQYHASAQDANGLISEGMLLRHTLLFLAIPYSKLKLATDPAWTYTGTWTSFDFTTTNICGVGNAYANHYTAKYTTGINNTATITLKGTTIYVSLFFEPSGNDGTGTISVDGTVMVNFNTLAGSGQKPSGQILGCLDAPMVYRISGLTPGSHTVQVKLTGGALVVLNWAIGNGMVDQRRAPIVYALATSKETAAAYATQQITEALLDQYIDVYRQVATELAEDGFNVVFVDLNKTFDPNTMTQSDGDHPTAAGHQELANIIMASVNRMESGAAQQITRVGNTTQFPHRNFFGLNYLLQAQSSAPGAPATGYGLMYLKSAGNTCTLHMLLKDGTDVTVSTISGTANCP
jgi:lysophospholipase L1-like esterase